MEIENLSTEKKNKIHSYLEILFDYNKKFNLTSFKNKNDVFEKGIKPLESVLDYVTEGECLDIGSGSGIPAIPLSIITENTKWTLLEPSQKKAGFLIETAIFLNLKVKVVTKSVEEFFSKNKTKFSVITVRGVRLNSRILKKVKEHIDFGGNFIVFTGRDRKEEYLALLNRYGFDNVLTLERSFSTILINVPRGTKSE